MKYAFLIYHDEVAGMQRSPEEGEALMNAYWAFQSKVTEEGTPPEAGQALLPTTAATTVRVRDGQTLTTDGPFAETKEQLGGFYIFDCRDLDHAIEIAAQIPDVDGGSVEIRPVVIFD